ncbi:DTW domain containing protein [Paraglaciecola sp. T6c]|uniref:tRNA-uridine aminocarboxypropyltransferase n=1 Tax=Pseudoalteromonas atlantica (strain T6c / ATCC BAA-1087) TaxID=3042615 RepID=UPI00005C5A63|nr:tRNA-uridine aminocarboxypropyltransferase [Paraglaciecola sp. T6c]ABG42791.1 DTW domain containing protein [Paraglaciecola sp. T6c]
MKRAICRRCDYPLSVCICDLLCEVISSQRIIILQHPSEAQHAKNSAKLVKLCIPESEIWLGESAEDFSHLQRGIKTRGGKVAVVYPNDDSVALESLTKKQRTSIDTLILIDATWRKAYKIWQLNPWLKQYSSWHFAKPPASQYVIRKTSIEGGLSTLEALAHALTLTQEIDTSELVTTFDEMQNRVFARHTSKHET